MHNKHFILLIAYNNPSILGFVLPNVLFSFEYLGAGYFQENREASLWRKNRCFDIVQIWGDPSPLPCFNRPGGSRAVLHMKNTVLSFTERSGHCQSVVFARRCAVLCCAVLCCAGQSADYVGHCGATSSDHQSWHPLATSVGDKVASYTVRREHESRQNSTSVNVTL